MAEVLENIQVTTLGRFSLYRNKDAVSGGYWNRRRVCELFKILLSAEQHRLHREQVQDLLWPDFSIEQAANSFGKTLYLLRRALEPTLVPGQPSAYLTLDQDILTLIPDAFKIDADLFEAQTRQIQRQTPTTLNPFDRVLSLYGGDYLPEDPYVDWVQRRRDRLRLLYSWLLEHAARLAISTAQGQQASEYLRTLLEQNPLDEAMHRELMLIYARIGRRSEAMNHYQTMRKILRAELHTEPAPETLALFNSIQNGKISPDLADFHLVPARPALLLKTETPAPLHIHAHASEDEHTIPHQMPTIALAPPRQENSNILPATLDTIVKGTLVGRTREIERLQQAFHAQSEAQLWLFFISGEAGIGKTRLAREFSLQTAEKLTHILWCTCDELSGTLPYQPIIDMLAAHIRSVQPALLRTMLGQSAVDLAKIIPEINTLLPDLPPPEPFGREVEKRNLYHAVASYIRTLASKQRLLLVLDDLQWADSSTIQLLSYVLQHSTSQLQPGRKDIFVLLLYRNDEVHETHPLRDLLSAQLRTNHAEEIRLKRLKEDEVQQLLTHMAGHTVGETFTEEIYRQTEGNPFFIGEAIRSLIEEGKLKKVGERWQTTIALNKLALPQSVRLLIERRLINLSPACRLTLAYAALLGRQFHSSLLGPARHLPEEQIAEHVDEALRTHILMLAPEEAFHQDADLLFTHDKIREVLAMWLNPLRRRTAHAQLAQALETRYATHLAPFYSMLAYHYRLAEESTKATSYLQKAADQAMSIYAFTEAASLMEQALELLVSPEQRPQRAELLRKLSIDAYLYTGQPARAIEAGLAACKIWQELGDSIKEAEIQLDISFSFHWMGKEQASLDSIKRALDCLKNAPEEIRLRAKAHVQWGLSATNSGDMLKANEELQLADELHSQIGNSDPFIGVVSLWARSWYAFACGTQQEMLDYAQRSAALCRAIHMFAWEPMMTYSAAWAMMLMGRLPEAVHTAQETREKALRHNAVGAQGWANLVLSFVAIQQGDWEKAEQFAQETSELAHLMHDSDLLARTCWVRSICSGWQEKWELAITQSLEALNILTQNGEISLVYPYFLLQTAKAYFYAGSLIPAQHYLDQACAFAQEHHYRQLTAISQRIQGRILQAQGKFAEALSFFEESQTNLAILNDEVEYARTQEAFGLYFQARNEAGDQQQGEALLQEAHAIFARMGIKG